MLEKKNKKTSFQNVPWIISVFYFIKYVLYSALLFLLKFSYFKSKLSISTYLCHFYYVIFFSMNLSRGPIPLRHGSLKPEAEI
jgi:hypothetical protein